MPKKMKNLIKTLSIMIMILLVSYAFIAYLPHNHECLESDCAVCNMADFSREFLIGIALLTIALILQGILFTLPTTHERIVLFSEGTPVGLKVKLSN